MRIDLDSVRQHLADGGSPNRADQHGRTVLSHMAGQGRVDIMTLLLEHGADVEQPDDTGDTPLSYAAVNSREATLLLLEYGAAVEAPAGTDRKSPLAVAAHWGDVEVMETLLVHGAHVDARTSLEGTALMRAALTHRTPAARLLLDHQADINIQDCRGNSALHYAVMARPCPDQEAMVRLLLEHRADPDLINQDGAFAENLAQGAAREVLVAVRVERERQQLRRVSGLTDDRPEQRRRCL